MKTGKTIQDSEFRIQNSEKNSSGAIRSATDNRKSAIGNSAFTLIEIMVAIAIFSMVVAAIFSTLLLVLRATEVGQSAAARAQRERVTMNTIENSLMCIQSFQASPKYYSFVV
jgi:prepilin-type N-terminal cleavage/methylation domain-containing protein